LFVGYQLSRCYNGVRRSCGSSLMYLYRLLCIINYYKILIWLGYWEKISIFWLSLIFYYYYFFGGVIPSSHLFLLLFDQQYLRNVHPCRFQISEPNRKTIISIVHLIKYRILYLITSGIFDFGHFILRCS